MRGRLSEMRIAIFTFVALSFTLPQRADDYDSRYAQAINLLYQQNQPQQAFDIFADLDHREPERSWATAFMCGYALRVYLKKPAESLPYLIRSRKLVKGENEDPYKNAIQAREDLKDYAGALRESDAALKDLRAYGKTASPWFAENRAYILMQLGRFDEALRTAPPGSWVSTQLAPREIRIEWKLNFAKLMQQWGIAGEKTVRLSQPLERAYQKVLQRDADLPPTITSRYVTRDGLRYLELNRAEGTEWPAQITLRFLLKHEPARGNRNMRLAAVSEGSQLYAYASDNAGGTFSLDNEEFISLVHSITARGRTQTEKAILALDYVRANFRYGTKPNLAKWNAHDALKFGSGDCGYYSYISIAMLRALKIPVRGIYGLNQWHDPAPALPHAILEIYDAGSRQWLPHDPQSPLHFGFINTNYVPLFAPNPMQSNSYRAADGVVEIDTTYFFWSGSGADTLVYEIRPIQNNAVASRSLPGQTPAATFTPSAVQPKFSTGPLPR